MNRKKAIVLLELGKPKLILLFGIMAFVGAIFSPNFNSDSFPQTFFSTNIVYMLDLLSIGEPAKISIIHAIGAFFISGMIWFGTALFNDYYDMDIDRRINPHRPLIKGEISSREVKFYAFSAYIIAAILVFLEGDLISKILVILFISVGFMYSAPPLRFRREGVAATSIIGAGIFAAFLGGSASQYSISLEAITVAFVLGILASVASSIKDYKDIDGDKEAGIKTLPIIYGYDRSIKMNKIAIVFGYSFSMFPYFLGYLSLISLPLIIILAIVNLKLINDLKIKKDLESKRKIYTYCLICYFAVVLVFVLTKILQ